MDAEGPLWVYRGEISLVPNLAYDKVQLCAGQPVAHWVGQLKWHGSFVRQVEQGKIAPKLQYTHASIGTRRERAICHSRCASA